MLAVPFEGNPIYLSGKFLEFIKPFLKRFYAEREAELRGLSRGLPRNLNTYCLSSFDFLDQRFEFGAFWCGGEIERVENVGDVV